MARSLGVDPDMLSLGDPVPGGGNLVALDGAVPLRTPRLLSRGFALACALLVLAIAGAPFLQQQRTMTGLERVIASSGADPATSSAQAKLASLSAGATKLSLLRHERAVRRRGP